MNKNIITAVLSWAMCLVCAVGIGFSVYLGKHRHEYTETVTEPTCTEQGYTTFTCGCGHSFADNYIDARGHNYIDGICSVCGTEHNHNFIYGVCDTCGVKHSHVFAETVTEPTCTEAGYTAFLCEPCGYGYTDNLTDPLGHDFADGICTRCNKNEYTFGLEYTLSDDGTYYICSGLGTAKGFEIVIASEYNGKPVKAIGKNAFKDGGDYLISVTVPDSVVSVDSWAFYYCNGLTVYFEAEMQPEEMNNWWKRNEINITIPVVWNCRNNEVAEDGYIYSVINGLRYALKDGNATVARQPKGNINGNLSIPQTVTYKGNTYIVTAIGDFAFYKSFKITGIEIGESITSIGKNSIYMCGGLQKVIISNSITYIGDSAVSMCDILKRITYNGTVEQWNLIEKEIFSFWGNLADSYIIQCADGIVERS